jgi:hypothetical protein
MSCSDDFPWPPRISIKELAKLLYEREIELQNQKSQSPEIKPLRFGGACTYLTCKEAAKYLHLTTNHLNHHPKYIPYYKIGKRVLYIKEELDEIVRRSRQGGES